MKKNDNNIINARVTFRTSPIHILEKFTFKNMDAAYHEFKKHVGLDECLILQTCNRVEIFAIANKKYDTETIKKIWASLAGLEDSAFNDNNNNFEYVQNNEACRHLLRLTSGLDSMVVGEEQILGQIKNSLANAKSTKSTGEHLNTLFDKALKIGTKIRNSTEINRGGISVGSMAVKLAEENVDDLKTKTMLLIGTGEIATLVAKSLARRGYNFHVTSRTLQRAQAFCNTLGGKPVRFEDILASFGRYDIILVATAAPYFLVTYEKITRAIQEKQKGMMILDLSNPRTVDEKVATISGVKLMNLDQIAEMVDKNMKSRINKVKTIEGIINEELEVLKASMNRLNAEPMVKEIFKNIDVLREKELQKAIKILGENDQKKIKVIDDLTKSLVESIVSTPINNIRKASEDGESDTVDIASKLFDYAKNNHGK